MKSELLSLLFIQKLILSTRSGALIKRITILSFIAIVISLTSFFIVLFVMNGMNLNIKKRIVALEPHLTTFQKSSEDQDVKNIIGKAEIIYYQNFDLILRTIDGQFRGAQATGYDDSGLKSWMNHLRKMRGLQNSDKFQAPAFDDEIESIELAENEVAIGVDLARSLGLLEGDEIILIPPETLLLSSLETPLFQKVTVRRIITTDLYDLDSKLILYDLNKTLLSFSKTLSLKRGFHVWLDAVSDASEIKVSLLKKNILSETWQEKNSDLFFALLMEKSMIGVFLGLAGLIASSSILTVLALLLSQKKRDIAIIKTLGLSQRKTLWLFTKMGLWISCSAILLGSAIGLAISYYLQFNPVHLLPNIYYDSSIPALVDLRFVGVVISVSLVLAFLGSYLPARATLKIQPALLLRQKN
ncbi:MAG: FtsX-like permease family protein [Pseudobdellovibrio sp.]